MHIKNKSWDFFFLEMRLSHQRVRVLALGKSFTCKCIALKFSPKKIKCIALKGK